MEKSCRQHVALLSSCTGVSSPLCPRQGSGITSLSPNLAFAVSDCFLVFPIRTLCEEIHHIQSRMPKWANPHYRPRHPPQAPLGPSSAAQTWGAGAILLAWMVQPERTQHSALWAPRQLLFTNTGVCGYHAPAKPHILSRAVGSPSSLSGTGVPGFRRAWWVSSSV